MKSDAAGLAGRLCSTLVVAITLACAALPARATPSPAAHGASRPSPGELYAIRLRLLQHPGRVPELIRARPDYRNGSLVGYRVRPGPKPRLFFRLGLRPGDVVTRINGTPVTPGNRLWLISQVSLSSRVDVTLLRHNHRITFHYRFARQ